MQDNRLKLIVIDDDDLIIQSVRMSLPEQWSMVGISDIADLPDRQFDAAFVDIHLTGDLNKPEGLKVIQTLSNRDPHLEIIAISGDLNRDLMESCLKCGASRFLAKPLSREEIQLILEKIEALHLLKGASQRSNFLKTKWIGNSPISRDIRKQIASMKGERGPILIEAESGAGKEVTSRLLHEQEGGQRSFISVNVAAIPENLFESEMFGHVRGAFTGADQNKMGLAEAAHGGDLFLDEIEALPISQQPKLLRFLESGEIRRVGGKDVIKIQTRVIAATNQNLQKMVAEDKFREDLLWRLSGKKLYIAPLRERRDDIRDLCNHFVDMERPRRNKSFGDDAIEELMKHNWPGNVRELKRVCEQLCLHSPLPIIRKEDVIRLALGPSSNQMGLVESFNFDHGLAGLINSYEARIIRLTLLEETDIDMAAKKLGISRSSLYKKIKDYEIPI